MISLVADPKKATCILGPSAAANTTCHDQNRQIGLIDDHSDLILATIGSQGLHRSVHHVASPLGMLLLIT